MSKSLSELMIRPIICFDIETTGTDVLNDRILELSITKLNMDGSRQVKTRRFNPNIAIPKSATDIHGITNEDVKDEPMFASLAKSIYEFIKDCDIATFNGNRFDIPILAREFYRCGFTFRIYDLNIIDVRNIYTLQSPRDLASAFKHYTGKEIEGAHAASNDVAATLEILEHQVQLMEENNISDIAKFSSFGKELIDVDGWFVYDESGLQIMFTKGKHKGRTFKDVRASDPSYFDWMLFKMNPAPLPDTIDFIKKNME